MRTVLDSPSPHVIRTAEEYADAVAEVDRLLDLDPAPGSAEDDRVELLALLVADYDERNDPIDDSDLTPEAIADFVAEQTGKSI